MAAATLDEETTAKVLRQIEYYLGDASLPGDKFLLEKIAESEDGLVDLALLCTFQKMRTHLGVKETDPAKYPADKLAAVTQVLRKSDFLKLSENGQRVGRVSKLPNPEVLQAEVDARSIAAHPFPDKMGMEKVEVIFKPHAKVNNVRLPWHKNVKIPSGFALVEFSSKEEAEKLLKMELTCEGVKLELETKTAFDARKETLLANDKENGKSHEKKREKPSQKQEDTEEEIKKGVIVSFTAKKIEATEKKETEETVKAEETEKTEDEKKEEAQLSREHLKEGLAKFGTIKYVDYAKGKDSGFLRFADPEEAQNLREASKEGVIIANHLVTFEALEGEAEEEYLKKVKEGQGQRKRDFDGGRGFGGGRGRGGGGRRGRGGRGRGHKRSSDGQGPRAKAPKTEQT